MNQLDKELDELQDLSNYAMSISSYVQINITGMAKILKKFDKKFKRYNLNFAKKFIIEKYTMKNSDLLYINQYKILDEVGASVEELNYELKEQYHYLLKNPIKEANNSRSDLLNQQINKEININPNEGLFNEDNREEKLINSNENNIINGDLSNELKGVIKNKFNTLKNTIKYMEVFYSQTSLIFNIWKRYLKENDYKSGVYSVKSAGEINENSDSDSTSDIEKNESFKKRPQHYLSSESYWNIRIILIQALIMSICSSYVHPTIYYTLKSDKFLNSVIQNNTRKGFLSGLVISMSPIGGLISLAFSNFMIKKSYKMPIVLSSILSIIGNLIFIVGIVYASIILICIGRLITGFSLNTPVHRNYLLYFIPKRRISKYLLYFKLIVLLGIAFGPLLSYFCLVIMKEDKEIKEFLNAYTLPGWICFFSSIILLFIIIIMFSEPLSPKFVIYAEGQAPTDIMKGTGSFSIDNNLTRYEAEKLNEINQKVSNFNDENQFNDTNLVSLIIKDLIDLEIEPYGTIRKAFWVIMSYEFILSFTKFCYITMAPPFLYVNMHHISNGELKNQKIISLLYSVSLFLMIPTFCLNFFYMSIRINQILYIKIASFIFFILEFITTAIIIQYNDSPYYFYISFCFTILLAYIVEDQLIYFYTHIIPTEFKLGKIEGLTVLHIIKYLGYILGSASSLFALILKEDTDNEEENVETSMIIENCFALLIQFILLLIFFYYSKVFSDRPIRRILYSKNKREIKITEFY